MSRRRRPIGRKLLYIHTHTADSETEVRSNVHKTDVRKERHSETEPCTEKTYFETEPAMCTKQIVWQTCTSQKLINAEPSERRGHTKKRRNKKKTKNKLEKKKKKKKRS